MIDRRTFIAASVAALVSPLTSDVVMGQIVVKDPVVGRLEFGGKSDLWGFNWTPAMVDSANFGVEIRDKH